MKILSTYYANSLAEQRGRTSAEVYRDNDNKLGVRFHMAGSYFDRDFSNKSEQYAEDAAENWCEGFDMGPTMPSTLYG